MPVSSKTQSRYFRSLCSSSLIPPYIFFSVTSYISSSLHGVISHREDRRPRCWGICVLFNGAVYRSIYKQSVEHGKVTVDNELKMLEVGLPRKNTKCIRIFGIPSAFEASASCLGILHILVAFRKLRYENYATG